MVVELRPETPSYNFSGHETFPFRYTWLPKAIQGLGHYPDLFTREDALIHLGVGKNMVASIRYWAQALELVSRPERGDLDEPTELGTKLLGTDGWDPYLEDPGTLWLLHWQLTSRPTRTSTWYLAFTQWGRESFSRAELVDWLVRLTEPLPNVRATSGPIKRDVDVFVRTYLPSAQNATKYVEESFDSPLVELGLLREIERDLYGFVKGPKPALPDSVLNYAILDYWQGQAAQQQTVAFETLLHGRGGPGAAFKLSENALAERLERLPETSGMRFDDTAGMRQLLRTLSAEVAACNKLYQRVYKPAILKHG